MIVTAFKLLLPNLEKSKALFITKGSRIQTFHFKGNTLTMIDSMVVVWKFFPLNLCQYIKSFNVLLQIL